MSGNSKKTIMIIKQILRFIAIHVFDIIFLILSLFLILFSVISFLGGPDGKIGTPESILWGIVYLFLGILALRGSFRLLRKNNDKIARNEKSS
jgi:hypothetical protein